MVSQPQNPGLDFRICPPLCFGFILVNELEPPIHRRNVRDLTVHMLVMVMLDFLYFYFFDSLCPSQQFFSYVGRGLPGLNQY